MEQTLNQLEFQSRFALEEVQKHERIQQANQFEMDELIEALLSNWKSNIFENHEIGGSSKTNASLKKGWITFNYRMKIRLNKFKKQKELQRTWNQSCSCTRAI